MDTVTLNPKITLDQSQKALTTMLKNHNFRKSGTGRKWYITKLEEAQAVLAKVMFSEQTGNTYLQVNVGDDDYYINPKSDKDFDLIQSIPEDAIDNHIPVVVAPQVPDKSVTEEEIKRVEDQYGKDASAKYRRAVANDEAFVVLVSLGEYKE